MNIYVYSDESGVFDKLHNKYFVFGGLIILGTQNKEVWSRRYSAAEKIVRQKREYLKGQEIKATSISNGDKDKLYRSLNNCYKFGVVINQRNLMARIFESKKDKQRYLDYAYKIAVKRAFQELITRRMINPDEVERIHFYIDEHTTATNGCYELREGLEQEFKNGTYNYTYCKFYPPIFPKMHDVQAVFCDSASKLLVRSADIVANRIYYMACQNKAYTDLSRNLYITTLP